MSGVLFSPAERYAARNGAGCDRGAMLAFKLERYDGPSALTLTEIGVRVAIMGR